MSAIFSWSADAFAISSSVSTNICLSSIILFFDYILVTDTEGLRAPNQNVNKELNHDNMLATFVIAPSMISNGCPMSNSFAPMCGNLSRRFFSLGEVTDVHAFTLGQSYCS
jgi:hypothetical protein